jgi:hypothetical protein
MMAPIGLDGKALGMVADDCQDAIASPLCPSLGVAARLGSYPLTDLSDAVFHCRLSGYDQFVPNKDPGLF